MCELGGRPQIGVRSVTRGVRSSRSNFASLQRLTSSPSQGPLNESNSYTKPTEYRLCSASKLRCVDWVIEGASGTSDLHDESIQFLVAYILVHEKCSKYQDFIVGSGVV